MLIENMAKIIAEDFTSSFAWKRLVLFWYFWGVHLQKNYKCDNPRLGSLKWLMARNKQKGKTEQMDNAG